MDPVESSWGAPGSKFFSSRSTLGTLFFSSRSVLGTQKIEIREHSGNSPEDPLARLSYDCQGIIQYKLAQLCKYGVWTKMKILMRAHMRHPAKYISNQPDCYSASI